MLFFIEVKIFKLYSSYKCYLMDIYNMYVKLSLNIDELYDMMKMVLLKNIVTMIQDNSRMNDLYQQNDTFVLKKEMIDLKGVENHERKNCIYGNCLFFIGCFKDVNRK